VTTPPPDPAGSSDPPPPPPGDDEELLAAYVGPNWRRHYQRSFAAFRAGSFGPPINVAAALAPQWLAFRGFWLLQLVACFLYWIGAATVGEVSSGMADDWLVFVLPYVALGGIEGFVGDRLVYWRAKRALARVRARGLAQAEAVAAMRKAGGVSVVGPVLIPAASFAVIFLLIDSMGHGHSHEQAYVAAMKSDLRNLVTAEEAYFADNVTYTGSLTNMSFTQSTGVTITVGSVSGIGWSATATHNATPRVCGIYVGGGTPPFDGANEGEPKCGPADQVVQHRH